jgi:hypothetical protein
MTLHVVVVDVWARQVPAESKPLATAIVTNLMANGFSTEELEKRWENNGDPECL